MNRFPFPPYRSGIPHWTERVVSYCAKVLPIVFDNSLSYYEFLGHMQVKLNEVIQALNSQNLLFVEFTHMVELELQNFEKYMEERQDNFEQQMQEEWQAFKTEMETAWNDFKTAMEEEWQQYQDDMNEAWNDFKADMLQRFQTFQDTITAQQTAFEQRMQAVQQQFEDDMENRADTFEQTLTAQQNTFEQTITGRQNAFEQNVETELEEWKDLAIRAVLDAVRQELPDIIQDVVSPALVKPIVDEEVARNGFAKILSESNQTAGAPLDLSALNLAIYDGGTLRADSLTVADLANVEIKPETAILFTSNLLWKNVGVIKALISDPSFPASDWRLQIGKYTTNEAIGTTFDISAFEELTAAAISDASTAYYANSNGGRDAGLGYFQYVCIRFVADPAEPSFTCDYSAGIELDAPYTADLVIQSEMNGHKYTIPKYENFGKLVLTEVHNTTYTTTYTITQSDFNNSQVGLYMIYIIGWAVSPPISIYALAYSGNVITQNRLTKIFGTDVNITLNGDTLTYTGAGKILIAAMS